MFYKIKPILTSRGKPCDPLKDFILRDDGAGPYIAAWNEDTLGPRPTQAELDAIDTTAMEHNAGIDAQIAALEATVTPRRMREAVRGSGMVWLENLDDQIATLRAQRNK